MRKQTPLRTVCASRSHDLLNIFAKLLVSILHMWTNAPYYQSCQMN